MVELAFFLAILVGVVAGLRLKQAFTLLLILGLVQDPLRKMVTGQPVVLTGLLAVAFAIACAAALASGVRLAPNAIRGWREQLSAPFLTFIFLLVCQAVHSALRWGNPALLVLGGLFYLAPIVAFTFGYQLSRRIGTAGVYRWMGFYVAFSLVWFIGIYLNAIGVPWRVLGEVGVGQIIYDVGAPTKANAGFYRAAEIAAWHVATASCFLYMVLNGRKLSATKIALVVVVVLFLLGVGVATGRRKMLVQVVIFASTYLFLITWFVRGKARLGILALLLGGFLFGAVLTAVGPDGRDGSFDAPSSSNQSASGGQKDQFDAWRVRGLTVFKDIPDRFLALGYLPVVSAVSDYGLFGAGLGYGAQGAQHYGAGFAAVRGSSEGGLGKLALDLGLPGLAAFMWLCYAMAKMIWRRLHALGRGSPVHARLAFGFAGILVANVATFSVATQAFGDVLILLMLGWMVGFLLALPELAAHDIGLRPVIGSAPIGQHLGAMPGGAEGTAAPDAAPLVAGATPLSRL